MFNGCLQVREVEGGLQSPTPTKSSLFQSLVIALQNWNWGHGDLVAPE